MGVFSQFLEFLSPSLNGVGTAHSHEPPIYPCCEVALAEMMDGLSFFDLLKCGTCFVPWPEHDPSCSQHFRRDHRMELLKFVKRLPEYHRDLRLAKANGYVDVDE